jgi:hypothetical protein
MTTVSVTGPVATGAASDAAASGIAAGCGVSWCELQPTMAISASAMHERDIARISEPPPNQ